MEVTSLLAALEALEAPAALDRQLLLLRLRLPWLLLHLEPWLG